MSFFYPSNLEELGGQIRCFEGFRRSKPIKSLWFSSQKHSSRRPVDPILIMYSWFFISPKYTYGKVMENHTYIYIFMYVYIYTYYTHHISCTFVYCTIYISISTYLLCMYIFDLYYISTYLYSVYMYTYSIYI